MHKKHRFFEQITAAERLLHYIRIGIGGYLHPGHPLVASVCDQPATPMSRWHLGGAVPHSTSPRAAARSAKLRNRQRCIRSSMYFIAVFSLIECCTAHLSACRERTLSTQSVIISIVPRARSLGNAISGRIFSHASVSVGTVYLLVGNFICHNCWSRAYLWSTPQPLWVRPESARSRCGDARQTGLIIRPTGGARMRTAVKQALTRIARVRSFRFIRNVIGVLFGGYASARMAQSVATAETSREWSEIYMYSVDFMPPRWRSVMIAIPMRT